MTMSSRKGLVGLCVVGLLSAVAVSCAGGEQSRQDSEEASSTSSATGAKGESNSGSSESGGDSSQKNECLGTLTPPRGAGGASYLQETAYSSDESLQTIKKRARTQLRDRVCQGVLCGVIDQHVSIWKSHDSGGYRCVMAVIARSHIDEWKQRVEGRLSEKLAGGAEKIVSRLRDQLDGRDPRLSIAEIVDFQVPGGLRAEWLHSHLQKALDRASAHVKPLDPSWSGQGIPQEVDGVVSAQIVAMKGVEATFEVQWEVRTANRVLPGTSVRFPAAVAPEVDEATAMPRLGLESDQVALHFDSRPGGGLCHGQQTEIWLETTEDLYVRVLNLYGESGGSVIYPVEKGHAEIVEAGKPVSVGKLEALKVGEIGVERFIVIASPTKEGLGKFAYADRFCTLPSSMVQQLQRGDGLPSGESTYLTSSGYRLMDGQACEDVDVSEKKVERVRQALDDAPSCW